MITPALNDRLLLTFGTLLFREQVDDLLALNGELAAVALELRGQTSSTAKSNEGGWHSDGNIFDRPEPCLTRLADKLKQTIQYVTSVAAQVENRQTEMTASLTGWFNVNDHGDYNTPHLHSQNTWSGVYYVQTGPAVPARPSSGVIEFMDPRVRCDVGPKQGLSHSGTLAVTPRDGMLLVFPSYLQHFVHPYFGDEPRITLAFNSLVQSLQVREAPA